MGVFAYTALDATGKQSAGTLSAESRPSAVEQLAGMGLRPMQVEERMAETAPARRNGLAGGRVSREEVSVFIRGLSNLLAAGIPLSRALQILQREATGAAARAQWGRIYDDVAGGMTLAGALSRWPKSFPSVYVAMVRAGETGGFLDLVLSQIADFQAREQELKGRVRAALVYPSILAALAVVVVAFLMTFFIPRFSGIFADFGGSLPALTRAIVAVSRWLTHYGLVLIAAIAAGAFLAQRALSSEKGRRFRDFAALRAPGVGAVVGRFALVRFCRTLGTLLGAGVPLVMALRVAKQAIGHQTLSDALDRAIEDVQRGEPLAKSLASCPQLFGPSIVEMTSVAEESGRLDKELVRMAGIYEAELDRRLRMLVALVEPAMLFIMAAVIGTIIIGMLLPVFTIQELIH